MSRSLLATAEAISSIVLVVDLFVKDERRALTHGLTLFSLVAALAALVMSLDRFFEDLPPREIARRESVSIHTVESRLQRALAKLRGRLSRELADEVGGARHALLLLAGLRPEGAVSAGAGR